MKGNHNIAQPLTVPEALLIAYEQALKTQELERQLGELLSKGEFPEVLRPADIMRLMHVGKNKVFEWTNDPTFPVLNKRRKKGEVVTVRKVDFYEWLKYGRTNESHAM